MTTARDDELRFEPDEEEEGDGWEGGAMETEDSHGGAYATDDEARYLREAGRKTNLTSAEEAQCRRDMRAAVRAARRDPGKASPGDGDNGRGPSLEACRERLVRGHLLLAISIARNYKRQNPHTSLSLGDLIQEGALGLMTAAEKFDPERDNQFATYATSWIRNSICLALSQKARVIRIPLKVLARRRRAARVADEVEQRLGNAACRTGRRRRHTTADDAAELGTTTESLQSLLRSVPDVLSLDAPPAPGQRTRGESVADDGASDPMDEAADSERHGQLESAIAALPERLRTILRLRFGLDGNGEVGLAEVGNRLGISAERVRQLQQQALTRLRQDQHLQGESASRIASGTAVVRANPAAAPSRTARLGRSHSFERPIMPGPTVRRSDPVAGPDRPLKTARTRPK